jgi:hypothetical protein
MLIILPWLANFAPGIHSRNFFVLTGALMLAIWFMTGFRACGYGRGRPDLQATRPRICPESGKMV